MTHICNISSWAFLLAAGLAFAAPPEIASQYQHYSIKLNPLYTPGTQTMGVTLKARVNGGPTLRLLLDSGAQSLVLNRRAAGDSGRAPGSLIDLVGVGAVSKAVRRLAPSTIAIGDLVLNGCETLSPEEKLIDGIDGVIPLSLFGGFLVRLDVPGNWLNLDPYPTGAAAPDDSYSPALAHHNLLFLQAGLSGQQSGLVLLDTGASYSAISSVTARAWKNFPALMRSVALQGGTGEAEGTLLPGGVQFRLGSQVLSANPAVIVDLSDMTRHHQFEVAGVLGYSALRRSILTINYRDSLVRIETK